MTQNTVSQLKTLQQTINDQQQVINSLITQHNQSQAHTTQKIIDINENQNRQMIADLRQWQLQTTSDLVRTSYLPPLLMIFIMLMLVGGLATMLTLIIWLKAWATLGWISLALIILAIIAWVIFLLITNKQDD